MSEPKEPLRKRTEFDDALKGYYHDHDEVRPSDNLDYRSLTAESVGSLVLGFLSILTIISGLFVIFPIIGVILGIIAIRKILQASEVLSGLGISSAGVALSLIFGTVGVGYQYYLSYHSTPPGYTKIDFEMLAPDPRTGRIPQEILELARATQEQGHRVFIEGYMYQTRNMTEIDAFVLVPALEQSRFGAPTRRATEMVDVSLRGDLRADYRTSPVGVGGVLYVNEEYSGGILPYRIEADIFR